METTIAPWLAVTDGTRAVDHYMKALGAVEVYRLDGENGKVAVAQLMVDGAAFWVEDDQGSNPASRGQGAVRLIMTVEDPDARFNLAVAAGAIEIAAVHEEHGWRTCRVSDPFGHDWEFSRPVSSAD